MYKAFMEKLKSKKSVDNGLTRKEKIVKETKSIILILVSVFAFRSTFFEPFRIPSGSMIPTLMIGDFILVNKFSYGFKIPFSDLSIGSINLNPKYVIEREKPKRGDVIVFKFPRDPNINYIKRVIGLPGDTIEIKNKKIYVNDEPVKLKVINGKEIMSDMDEKFLNYNFKFYKEATKNKEYTVQQDQDNYYKVDYQKRTVPENHYFVMGDNRDYSFDSRFWGMVPFENIKGEAILVWFSMIFPFGENSFKFRPWRMGNLID